MPPAWRKNGKHVRLKILIPQWVVGSSPTASNNFDGTHAGYFYPEESLVFFILLDNTQ